MFQPVGGWFTAKRTALRVWTTSNRTGPIYGRRVCARGWHRAAVLRCKGKRGEVSGPENLDFFTEKSLVDDPYDYYDAIRRCPIWREPAHGVVMVSGYDEAIAVQRDPDQA